MATVFDVDLVRYHCSCARWQPLCRQYFCRHCMVLRCGMCVSHEVDSIFCPSCLENMPSAEARLKRNQCGNCYNCPSCANKLSTRATSASGGLAGSPAAASGDEKIPAATPRKVFYWVCGFCRWTSRDAGIPDQTVATGSWPDPKNPHSAFLMNVLEHFRGLAQVEKAERERKRYTTKRKTFLPWTDRYGLSAILTKKSLGIAADQPLPDKEQNETEKHMLSPSEEVEELPDSIFTESLKLEKVTTIFQRHSQPEFQPALTSQLYPVRQQLIIKRSQRCKVCDHNLCKAEFSPNSIKFKIQLSATFHVPEFRLLCLPELLANKQSVVKLTLCNNSATLTHVVLLPDVEAMGGAFVEPEIPVSELVLPFRDDSAEYDDGASSAASQQYNDDTEVVIFRKHHKIGIQMMVTPPEVEPNEDLMLRFNMKYDYVNTVYHLTGEQKEPEIVWLHQQVCLNLGKLHQKDAPAAV